jgi:hypothetical protein
MAATSEGVVEPVAAPASLADCEAVIDRGLRAFVEVGVALRRILDDGLYRDSHATFEDYCRERWNIDRTYAHRIIGASDVVSVLPIGNRPATESQARELIPLRDDPHAVREAWDAAQRAAEADERRLTAKDVRAVVTASVNARRVHPTDVQPLTARRLARLETVRGQQQAAKTRVRVIHVVSATYAWRLGELDRLDLDHARSTFADGELDAFAKDLTKSIAALRKFRDRLREAADHEEGDS